MLLGSIGLWLYVDITKKGPCEEPIKYSIGAYDARFKISKADFKTAVDEAALVWETATGKNLFDYESTPSAGGTFYTYIGRLFIRKDIPVGLVYDERQQISEEHRVLVGEVNEQKESVNAIKAQFQSLQSQYHAASAEYQSMLSEYRKRKISFESLEEKRLQVNALADEINRLVKKYNYLVGELNEVVQTINKTAGHEFEEGQYVSDATGEKITIFEFADRQTLVRVLAHEFGHALGLDHNENPNSIMYYLNESSNMKPTKEDLAALSLICKAK